MSAVTVTGALLDGRPGGLRAEDGVITTIGADVAPGPGDEVIDAGGMALVPGLVNAHTHAAMTLFRGFADDLPLMTWLEEHIWPAEARLEYDDVYWGTRLACAEMIRTGTVAFMDMYWHPAAVAAAVRDSGIRAIVGGPLVDMGDPERGAAVRAAAAETLEELAGSHPRVGVSLTPHSIYAVSEGTLRWAGETSAERGIPVQIHLSETAKEVEDCIAAHGCRPAHYLDGIGLLNERVVLAHGVHLDDSELALIAERGATVSTNPVANMKLAVGGVFPYPAARAHGVRVGLGTDGPGSNNSLDLLSDAKVFALVQKSLAGDPAAVTAKETLSIARGERSPLLGGQELAPGARADFLLVRTDSPELSLGDLDAGLVYAASGSIVDTTVVDGRVLMRAGVIEGEEEARAHAVDQARRLGIA
jgi:5-methylthioadenosine/S-adenosylhomocysteine deaminase